jgi:hypothetical protein
MRLEFGLTDELTNTSFAPLAALGVYYRHQSILEPLQHVPIAIKTVQYSPGDKLIDALVSILAGCTHIAQINTRLRPEVWLARAWGRDTFVEQSTVSRTFDALTQTNLTPLRTAVTAIWRGHSQALRHDWRGWLWFDLDLSGLRASPNAEGSTKGYFSGEKTLLDGNWRGFRPCGTTKQCGRPCIQAIVTAPIVSARQCSR